LHVSFPIESRILHGLQVRVRLMGQDQVLTFVSTVAFYLLLRRVTNDTGPPFHGRHLSYPLGSLIEILLVLGEDVEREVLLTLDLFDLVLHVSRTTDGIKPFPTLHYLLLGQSLVASVHLAGARLQKYVVVDFILALTLQTDLKARQRHIQPIFLQDSCQVLHLLQRSYLSEHVDHLVVVLTVLRG